jgi:hypothetical protein
LPVTGVVAPGTGVTFALTGDSTAKSGSVSKLTEATPGVVVESGSVTKDVPFHTTASVDAVIRDERTVAVIGLRNVPGYGEPLRVTSIPAPVTSVNPGSGVMSARSGAVTVSCTAVNRREEGTGGNGYGELGAVDGQRPDGPAGRPDGHGGDHRGEPAGRRGGRHRRWPVPTPRRGREGFTGRARDSRRADQRYYG